MKAMTETMANRLDSSTRAGYGAAGGDCWRTGRRRERCWPWTAILAQGRRGSRRHLPRGIGVQGIVNSPTFTIIKEYNGEHLPLYHMDVYRLSEQEADELGLDDYFYGDGVTIVEWASSIEACFRRSGSSCTSQHLGGEAAGFRSAASESVMRHGAGNYRDGSRVDS